MKCRCGRMQGWVSRSLRCIEWVVGLGVCVSLVPSCDLDVKLEDECPLDACPDQSCEKAIECQGDTACPQGTSCRDTHCELGEAADIAPEVLIDGFRADEFDLTRAEEVGTRFELVAPEKARRVVCGLFACKPLFSDGSDGETTFGRLKNAARCLQRHHVFNTQDSGEPQKFTFRLADLRPPEPTECSSSMLGLGVARAGYPIVEALRLGCWASDKARVLSATRLMVISVSELPEGASALRSDCEAAADGSWCSLPGDLGTCQAGRCDFTKTPNAGTSPIDSGGAANDSPASHGQRDVPVDCEGLPDDVTCRRKTTDAIGQCLSGRCIQKTHGGKGYSQPLAVSDCAAPGSVTDWLNCYPSPILSYGTCLSQACRLRCRSPQDCTDALQAAGVRANERYECERPEGSYLGVCVPETRTGAP